MDCEIIDFIKEIKLRKKYSKDIKDTSLIKIQKDKFIITYDLCF